jgi:hypothetical protein
MRADELRDKRREVRGSQVEGSVEHRNAAPGFKAVVRSKRRPVHWGQDEGLSSCELGNIR